ncbi:MAG: amidase family protein, partial [Thermaerobacterales bacterium]
MSGLKARWDTAWSVAAAVSDGDISAAEAVQDSLARIETLDGAVGAFLRVTPERALERARAVDDRRARGEKLGPLAGVPVAVKDNICTMGVETTAASRMLAGFVPPYDATVIRRLEDAGAIVVGKTNLDEFAMGSSTESSAYQLTRNPWDLDRVPGGSSGGSAAAVAAGMVPLSLGSDTGGSVRQPAALCGVMGLRATYGRMSRYGLIAFASSLDVIGQFARDARDVALLLEVTAGHDANDSTSAALAVEQWTAAAAQAEDLQGLRIGVPAEMLAEGADPRVMTAVDEAMAVLKDLGAEVHECSVPHARHALPVYYLVANAEAASNLSRYDGVRFGHRSEQAGDLHELYRQTRGEGFGPEVTRRIMLGTYALSSGYYHA